MAVDAEGEILARGNMVMDGYWDQPDQTDAAIHDGFFHTGDGGTIDDDNYVTISDRKKDVIITGGENVSSIEVEDAIFQHPDDHRGRRDRHPRREVGRTRDGAGRDLAGQSRSPRPR